MNRILIEHLLLEHRWDVAKVQAILGVHRASLYRLIKRHGIHRPGAFVKGNHNRNKTHCKRSHLYTLRTTKVDRKTGYRKCRRCEAGLKALAAEADVERSLANNRRNNQARAKRNAENKLRKNAL